MLTVEQLKAMPEHTVFATGVTTDPRLHEDPIRWVAKRGKIHDWALYYHHAHHSVEYVRDHGDKLFTDKAIRDLVPCTDEAFNMYRK